MAQHDPFLTLGVSPEDGPAAIRGAFLDLLRSVETAHDRSVLRDAYEVLDGGPRAASAAPASAPALLLDLLADFDGERPSRDEVRARFRRRFAHAAMPKSGRLETLELAIRVEGPVVAALALPVYAPCVACHGTGRLFLAACRRCDGEGVEEARAHVAVALDPRAPVTVIDVGGIAVRVRMVC